MDAKFGMIGVYLNMLLVTPNDVIINSFSLRWIFVLKKFFTHQN